MLLGIISDTHGHAAYAAEAVERLKSLQVDEVIHCGDIGSPAIVELLRPWPTHYVLGNCDGPEQLAALTAAIQRAGHTLHGRFGELTRAGRRIAFLHGDDARLLEETIEQQQYDLVCCGHTHLVACRWHGRTLALNPGALYRADPHSFAVVELPGLDVTPIRL